MGLFRKKKNTQSVHHYQPAFIVGIIVTQKNLPPKKQKLKSKNAELCKVNKNEGKKMLHSLYKPLNL